MSKKRLNCLPDTCSVRWYRGLSCTQSKACENLLNALRDDTDQESTYRVRRCLSHLGLHPLVESAQIRAIMGISQGSDLAFLWFLWEASYKQPRGKHEDLDPTSYTVNEQLLLSGIAHLDMPSTLRALDALLPPPCQSKKPRPQCPSNVMKRNTHRIRQPRQRDQRAQPYFDRLVRPRQFTPKGKVFKPPESKLQFPDYLPYEDRMLEIPNERCRWFAEYQLCPQKRVVMRLLNEELNRLLNSQSPEGNGSLCETHRFLENQRVEKANEVFHRCLPQLDVPRAELKARRKSIVADLEREIECAADKIRAQSERLLKEVKSIRNEKGTGCCQLCNSIVSTRRRCPRPRADLSLLMMGHSEVDLIKMEQNDEQIKVMVIQGDEPNRCGAGDCKFIKPEDTQNVQKKEKQVKKHVRGKKSRLKVKISQTFPLKSQESSGSGMLRRKLGKSKEKLPVVPPTEKLTDRIPVCSRTLPCAIRKGLRHSESQTFCFRTAEGIMLDYNKVFDLPGIPEEHLPLEDSDYVDVEDKQPVIEKLCIAALKEGEFKAVKELRRDEDLSPVLKAAATCAVNMFRTKLAEVEKNSKEYTAREAKENEIEQKNHKLIDPNNKQQIEDILRVALQKLRGDPHFVLASFPNAHKFPILLDWVANRYGKTFSQKEMQAQVKSSFQIYKRVYQDHQDHQAAAAVQLKKRVTDLNEEVTFKNLKKLTCLTNQMKVQYHKKLNELALEQSRLIWLGLRAYSHLGGNIKDTFFAYMPAREMDFMRKCV